MSQLRKGYIQRTIIKRRGCMKKVEQIVKLWSLK